MSLGTTKNIIGTIAEPLTTGIIAGVAAHFLVGTSGSAQILGMSMPPSVAVGLSVGASSLAAESIKRWAIPQWPALQSAGAVVKPVLTGAVSVGALMALTDFNSSGALTAFGVGAGSEIAGGYVFGMVVDPLLSFQTGA